MDFFAIWLGHTHSPKNYCLCDINLIEMEIFCQAERSRSSKYCNGKKDYISQELLTLFFKHYFNQPKFQYKLLIYSQLDIKS